MDGKSPRDPASRPKKPNIAARPDSTSATVPSQPGLLYDPDEPLGIEQTLSLREQDTLHYMAGGKANADIAKIFGSTRRTVESHIGRIFRKLGVKNRHAAIALYRDWSDARQKRQIARLQAQVQALTEQVAALRRQLTKQG